MSDSAGKAPVRAGIIVTGTEVITGTIADRNGPWVSERLGELGVEVAYILTVADRPGDLTRTLEFFRSEGLDLVVTTGGLGPTADDLTAEVVADFAGRELQLDQAMEAKIGEILARFARSAHFDTEALMASNRKQAMVPEGATALDPIGTAPGLVVPAAGQVVVVLPGPPRELQPMWQTAIGLPEVAAVLSRATPLHARRLRLFGVPESEIARSLRELEAGGTELNALEITTCLRKGELEIDLRWRGNSVDVADQVTAGLAERHSRALFSDDGTTVDAIVAERLAGRRLALAESCSSGLLAARITDLPGASAYFAGGAVTYSNQAKTDLLGVPASMIEDRGAVSPEVAEAMAVGALERFSADTAVAITGVAGPGGGTETKPVGYVCLHAQLAGGRSVSRDPVIPGNRGDIRERSALVAMHMLRDLLSASHAVAQDHPPPPR